MLTKCCYFGTDQSSNIATRGAALYHRIVWEIHTKIFFYRTAEWVETKNGENVPSTGDTCTATCDDGQTPTVATATCLISGTFDATLECPPGKETMKS